MKEKLEIFISIFIIFLCIFINIIFEKKEQIILIILNINIFYLSYKLKEEKKNIMIFYFVVCNFLFNTSIALTKLLDRKYILESMFFTYGIPFNVGISKFIYNILIINSLGIVVGIIIIYFLKKKVNRFSYKIVNKEIFNIIFYISIIFFIYIIYLKIKEIKLVLDTGYVNSYLIKTSSNLSYYVTTLFNFLFIIFLSLKKKYNKKVGIVLFINLLITFIGALKGSRGHFLITLLFVIWYLEVLEIFKIKKRYIIFIIFLVSIYSDFILNIRESYGTQNNITIKIENIVDLPIKFLKSQNETSKMIGYIKTYPEIINGRNNGKMIFAHFYNFYDSFFRKNLILKNKYDENVGRKKSDFSRISYIVNSSVVRQGGGLGGNYIIEMYEVGKEIGVFCLSVFYVLIIYFLENILKKNNSIYKNIFVIFTFQNIFMAPRSYYFDFNIRTYIYIYVYYILFYRIV